MPRSCCPTCGRALPKPKTVPTMPDDTSKMTEKELYAYYKATSALGDAKHLMRAWTPEEGALIERNAALIRAIEQNGGAHTPATKAEYDALRTAWGMNRPWPVDPTNKVSAKHIFYRDETGRIWDHSGEPASLPGNCIIRDISRAPKAVRAKIAKGAA